jgi:hypothetical protein
VRRDDDDHNKNTGMLINFFLIKVNLFFSGNMRSQATRKCACSETILRRQKTPDDGHIQPNHVMWKKADYTYNKLHLRRKYV